MTTIEREAYLMKFAIQTKNLCKEYKGELRVNHLNLNIPAAASKEELTQSPVAKMVRSVPSFYTTPFPISNL